MSSGESTSREYTYQLFVCYATEDFELVEPLVKRLMAQNITVWFDAEVHPVEHPLPDAFVNHPSSNAAGSSLYFAIPA